MLTLNMQTNMAKEAVKETTLPDASELHGLTETMSINL